MWDGKRRIEIGFIYRRPCYCGTAAGGGTLLLPREWLLLPDGTPATRPAAEILAAFREDAMQGKAGEVFQPVMSPWKISGDTAGYRLPDRPRA